MKDRRYDSNGELIEEWERPRTIPDDFIYFSEDDSYYPPGHYCKINRELRRDQPVLAELPPDDPLLTEEEPPAVVVLKLTPRKQKRRGGKPDHPQQRTLFSDLEDDADAAE